MIAMLDHRSRPTATTWRGGDKRFHAEQQRPPLSVWSTLLSIASHIAAERGIRLNPYRQRHVTGLGEFIDAHLDWLCRQDDVAEHAALIDRLVGQLRPITGEPARRCIGRCPNTIDDGESGSHECRARLFAPLHGDTIACRACGREWRRPEWERLGLMLVSA